MKETISSLCIGLCLVTFLLWFSFFTPPALILLLVCLLYLRKCWHVQRETARVDFNVSTAEETQTLYKDVFHALIPPLSVRLKNNQT